MAIDAGYENYDDLQTQVPAPDGELLVTEVTLGICECPAGCDEPATTIGDDGGSCLCDACSEYAVDDDGECFCSEHQPAEYARLTD